MKITRTYKYIEDREEFLEVPADVYQEWLADGGSANLSDPQTLANFYYFVLDSGIETQTHDFDNWYGNPIGEEFDNNFTLGE